MLKWTGEGESLRLCASVPGVVNQYPVSDIVACLKANPEALTPEQWANVLSALSPETQDGITDALVDGDVRWGRVSARSHVAHEWRSRAEQAERALATVTAERDGARAAASNYLERWILCGEWCREESANCRRRKGHVGPHTSALNEARRLDETLTRADVEALIREERERVIAACEDFEIERYEFAGPPGDTSRVVERPLANLADALRKAGNP